MAGITAAFHQADGKGRHATGLTAPDDRFIRCATGLGNTVHLCVVQPFGPRTAIGTDQTQIRMIDVKAGTTGAIQCFQTRADRPPARSKKTSDNRVKSVSQTGKAVSAS